MTRRVMILVCIAAVLLGVLLGSLAHGASVKLAWDAPTNNAGSAEDEGEVTQ